MEDSGTPWLMFLLYAFYLVIPLVSIPIVMWTQARGENSASCASRKFCCRNISKVTYVYTWIYLATAIFSVTPIGMEWEDGVYQMGTIYIISYVLAPACWFLGIMEYCLSSDTAYLHNLGDLAYLDNFIRDVKADMPIISFHVECYHYETKTRTVTKTDSDGNRRTETETYREKKVTYRGKMNYQFDNCEDISPMEVSGMGSSNIVRIKLTKSYEFGNSATSQDFQVNYDAFQAQHRNKVNAVCANTSTVNLIDED